VDQWHQAAFVVGYCIQLKGIAEGCGVCRKVTAHVNSYQLMIIAYCLFDCGRNELDFKATMSLKNSWNENYSIRVGRDGQVCMQFVSNNRCLDDVEYS